MTLKQLKEIRANNTSLKTAKDLTIEIESKTKITIKNNHKIQSLKEKIQSLEYALQLEKERNTSLAETIKSLRNAGFSEVRERTKIVKTDNFPTLLNDMGLTAKEKFFIQSLKCFNDDDKTLTTECLVWALITTQININTIFNSFITRKFFRVSSNQQLIELCAEVIHFLKIV